MYVKKFTVNRRIIKDTRFIIFTVKNARSNFKLKFKDVHVAKPLSKVVYWASKQASLAQAVEGRGLGHCGRAAVFWTQCDFIPLQQGMICARIVKLRRGEAALSAPKRETRAVAAAAAALSRRFPEHAAEGWPGEGERARCRCRDTCSALWRSVLFHAPGEQARNGRSAPALAPHHRDALREEARPLLRATRRKK